MMRKMVFLTLVFTLSAYADHRSHVNHRNCEMCVTTNANSSPVTSCDQLDVVINDHDAARAEEVVPVGGVRSLTVRAPESGGIYVNGSDANAFSVTACKAAEFEEDLRDIQAQVRGNELSATGPARQWLVYFFVNVPRNGTVDLSTNNGPITVRNVNGTVTARAINGPIGVSESTGTFNIETENGPISLRGGAGTVKLNATNGPISVFLRDAAWNGSLEAHTENGPLTARFPPDFRSGTVIEVEHGPVRCRAEVCRQAQRTWDDDDADRRKIEFGRGPTVVRMSTVNGPLSVKE